MAARRRCRKSEEKGKAAYANCLVALNFLLDLPRGPL
jgi:hypothetical protein